MGRTYCSFSARSTELTAGVEVEARASRRVCAAVASADVAAATCAAAWMAAACSDVLTLTFLYDEGTETPGAVMTCTLPAAS